MEKMYRKFFDEVRGRNYLQRISDNAFIPVDSLNSDYKQALEDIATYGDEIVEVMA